MDNSEEKVDEKIDPESTNDSESITEPNTIPSSVNTQQVNPQQVTSPDATSPESAQSYYTTSLSTNQAETLYNQASLALVDIDRVVQEEKGIDFIHQTQKFLDDQNDLVEKIRNKIGNFKKYIHTLRFKYTDFFRQHLALQIIIIVLSSIITLFGTILLSVETTINTTLSIEAQVATDAVPVSIASVITILGSIISLKKYGIKTENLAKTVERCVEIRTKLNGLKEQVNGCKDADCLNNLYKSYHGDILVQMNTCQEQVGRLINLEDQIISGEKISYLENRQQESNAAFEIRQAEIYRHKSRVLQQLEEDDNNE